MSWRLRATHSPVAARIQVRHGAADAALRMGLEQITYRDLGSK